MEGVGVVLVTHGQPFLEGVVVIDPSRRLIRLVRVPPEDMVKEIDKRLDVLRRRPMAVVAEAEARVVVRIEELIDPPRRLVILLEAPWIALLFVDRRTEHQPARRHQRQHEILVHGELVFAPEFHQFVIAHADGRVRVAAAVAVKHEPRVGPLHGAPPFILQQGAEAAAVQIARQGLLVAHNIGNGRQDVPPDHRHIAKRGRLHARAAHDKRHANPALKSNVTHLPPRSGWFRLGIL